MSEQSDVHLDPLVPPDEVFDVSAELRERCPVAHSDVDGGFWALSRYADVLEVLQDRAFDIGDVTGTGNAVRIPRDPPEFERPLMPPLDSNPPLHRQFRAILNPYLSPQRLAGHEPGFRSIIGGLLDGLYREGRCDLAGDFAKVFPSLVTYHELFSIDDKAEAEKARQWTTRFVYDVFREDPSVLSASEHSWRAWIQAFVERRRREARRDDVVDALLHGEVDSRPLTDAEVVGAIQILTLGGFMTTADATCNLVAALIDRPELQELLRGRPDLMPAFIEEVLRLDPPVTTRTRRCTREAEIRGVQIRPGDRVLLNLVAANRDPDEFDRPDDIELDRPQNRHLVFGAGLHRCVGSNMARLTLRIMLEELLARVAEIRFPNDRRERRMSVGAASWRLVDAMPIVFRPLV